MNTIILQSDQECTKALREMGLIVDSMGTIVDTIQHNDRFIVMAHNWFGGTVTAVVDAGPDQWTKAVERFAEKAA
jgi:hypothetical protein